MPEAGRVEHLLTAESLAAVEAAGPVDLVVGVHTLNQVGNAAHVLEAASAGLAKHFPGRRTALLVADGGSQDGTPTAVRAWRPATASAPPACYLEYAERPDQGQAIRAILAAAHHLEATGCALVDAALASVGPDWVEHLLDPIARGEADFVSPAYTRSVPEGTLTTNLLAPLTRALYGRRIQQPTGGCAGVSGMLLARCADASAWERESPWATHGLEIWLATEAVVSGARLVETHLGRKRLAPSPSQPDVATTLVRAVGPLFALMDRHRAVWPEVRGSVAVPCAGDPPTMLADTGGVDAERMVRAFKLGLKDLLPVWEQVMPEGTLVQLYPLGLLAADEFRFAPPVWARVVSDFAVAYHERRLPREHLLRALTPLYLGRVAAFIREAQARPPALILDILEGIGRAFEAEKEHLVARWR